ncbi:MAG: segregation/condensation protein A [Bacilli bacterium]|nr:segregation/condensation protein A [Bacilli bacterium]
MDYKIHIENFEGPLDLLLHLVKETKMDIYEINMSQIIEEYLSYIEDMQNLNINIGADFLYMASSLVHLKSKMLIGKTIDEESTEEYDIVSEEDLREKIIEYEKYKSICDSLKKLEEKRGQIYTKLPENLKEYVTPEELFNESNLTGEDLMRALLSVEKRLKGKQPVETRITRREINVLDREIYIRNILKIRTRCDFIELFEYGNKPYLVATFLAILEMCRQREITLIQERNFENLVVEVVAHE